MAEYSFMDPNYKVNSGVAPVSVLSSTKLGQNNGFSNIQTPSAIEVPELGNTLSSGLDTFTGGDVAGMNTGGDEGGFFSGFGGLINSAFGDTTTAADGTTKTSGAWTNAASAAASIGQVALGAYSAMEQSKMNDFMKGYYSDQMDLQKTDFSNAAKSANEALSAKQGRILSAQGKTTGTAANEQGVASYMDTWGSQETV